MMNEKKEFMPENQNNTDSIQEVSILDLIVILVEQRWFITKVTMLFALLAVVYSLVATPEYKSSLQIMPPSANKSSLGDIVAAAGLGDIVGSGGGLGSSMADTVVGITKSTFVLDGVIDENGLMTREPEGLILNPIKLLKKLVASVGGEKERLRCDVREDLADAVQTAADKKSGIITVSVTDVSPDMAMRLAQSVYDNTLRTLQRVAVTPQAAQRVFLEEQLKTSNKELIQAEKNLIEYQNRTGMVGAPGVEQSATAALQARMVAKEIELKSALRFATDANPTVKRLRAEYAAIKKQFEADSTTLYTKPLSGVGVKNISGASVEYAAVLREYKFRETLLQILLRQYETAKLNEANSPLVIQMLSEPQVPEKRDFPKRKNIVLLATLLGGFMGVFFAFIRHFLMLSEQDPEVSSKINFVKGALRSDLFGFKKNKARE